MEPNLNFNPDTHRLTGPSGSLNLLPDDDAACRFLMLLEGECLHDNIAAIAAKYGYCRQRYYQLLERFKSGGELLDQRDVEKIMRRPPDLDQRDVAGLLYADIFEGSHANISRTVRRLAAASGKCGRL